MAELVQIPLANAEYVARFERPYIGFIANERARVIEVVFNALLPFNMRLADIDTVNTGSPAEHKVTFRIPGRSITFEFGAEEYKFNKDRLTSASASDDEQILLAAERALLEGNSAKVASCMLTVAMHMQPLNKTRDEILAPLVPEPFKDLKKQRQAWSFGNHMRFEDGDILLDFSVGFANGIFVRLTSFFPGHPPLSEIIAKLRSDKEALFGILGVEEAANA
jgi:hypothetical protein